jgi:uncharacterized protein YaaQ
MKMILAVIQDRDWVNLSKELTRNGFSVTKLSSTGGFLRQGNTTIMIGVEDHLVETILTIIRTQCKKKEVPVTMYPPSITGMNVVSPPMNVTVGGATVFILNMERFEQLE